MHAVQAWRYVHLQFFFRGFFVIYTEEKIFDTWQTDELVDGHQTAVCKQEFKWNLNVLLNITLNTMYTHITIMINFFVYGQIYVYLGDVSVLSNLVSFIIEFRLC